MFRSSFDVFLLFLRSISFRTSYPLEWKFIEFSGLFHCLIIKVRFAHSRKRLCYFITSFLTCQVLFFKSFKFFSMCFCSLEQLAYLIISSAVCQALFSSFSNFLNCSNCFNFSFISNASLSYHKFLYLSTTFLTFFKVFIVELYRFSYFLVESEGYSNT